MISTRNTEEQLVQVTLPLPDIPENSSKEVIRDILNDYAFKNNFAIQDSKKKRLVFVCKKGPGCKDWRNISSLDQKRISPIKKMNCAYTIRLSKKNNGKGHQIHPSKVLKEMSHNHPLDDDTLMSTHEGRMYKLSAGGINTICDGVKQSKSTKSIQRSISTYAKFNKLKRHDINNLRYASKAKSFCMNTLENAGSKLVDYVQNKGFRTAYRCNGASHLDGLFSSSEQMIARSIRFSESYLIDATYGTNNLKMPSISVYGISNVGLKSLKLSRSSLLGFLAKKKEMYSWLI